MSNDPAFPSSPSVSPSGDLYWPSQYGTEGMSVRDYLAGQALIGIIAHPQGKAGNWAEAAKDAYDCADAMLKVRDTPKNEN